MIKELIAVGAGGALGSAARYLVSYVWLSGLTVGGLPVGTFTVNVAGSMLIGYLAQTLNSSMAVWLLCVGFCGGFTTFSTFSADFIRLVRAGNTTGALLYVAATVAVCALATVAGARIAVATGR
ncbi:MAG: fluoride efflux transporter CrcB [Alistipes sp.]|nr:fluoride efflux transporter CrcB [Alistipes sp.]